VTVSLDALLSVALDAADIASDLLRTRTLGLLTAKGDRDMVTELDITIERAVRTHLQQTTPDIRILGEEEGTTGEGELLWALDPIDGTANLVHGIPLCGVSLGLIRRGRPVVGVIDLPFLNSRYTAVEGTGAYKGDQKLETSTTRNLQDAVVAVGDYATGEGAEIKNRLRLALHEHLAANVQRVRMLGSAAIDLAWLAEGRLDASLTMSNNPWDTAAGVIIAREAGATITDTDGTDHHLKSHATIATAPNLKADIHVLIKQTQEQTGRQRPQVHR
jgi:myo-inositol-1(or 4)-monophosphatase